METGIADDAGIAKGIANGKLWDVHMKAKVDWFTMEVDCVQTVIEDFICVCRGEVSGGHLRVNKKMEQQV